MAKSKAITHVSWKEAHPIRRRNKQVEEAAAARTALNTKKKPRG